MGLPLATGETTTIKNELIELKKVTNSKFVLLGLLTIFTMAILP
jgi:hypothetical protein